MRSQCVRSVMKKQVERMQENLDRERRISERRETLSKEIIDRIISFMDNANSSLLTQLWETVSLSTTELIMSNQRNIFQLLDKTIKQLIHFATRCMLDMDVELNEKDKALLMAKHHAISVPTLSIKNTNRNEYEVGHTIDIVLESMVKEMLFCKYKSKKMQSDIEEYNSKIQIWKWKRKVSNKDKEIIQLKEQIKQANEEIDDLQLCIEQLEIDLEDEKEELFWYQRACEKMFRSKRLLAFYRKDEENVSSAKGQKLTKKRYVKRKSKTASASTSSAPYFGMSMSPRRIDRPCKTRPVMSGSGRLETIKFSADLSRYKPPPRLIITSVEDTISICYWVILLIWYTVVSNLCFGIGTANLWKRCERCESDAAAKELHTY